MCASGLTRYTCSPVTGSPPGTRCLVSLSCSFINGLVLCVCVCFSAGPVHSAVWCVYPGLLRDWQAKFPSHRSAPPPPQGVAATHTNHPGGQQERPGSLPWNQLRGYVQTGITVDDLKKKNCPNSLESFSDEWNSASVTGTDRFFFLLISPVSVFEDLETKTAIRFLLVFLSGQL